MLRSLRLSKYNDGAALARPPKDHVLVIDQTRSDASIAFGGADETTFARMLDAAIAENPDAEIIVKTHPETAHGVKPGHFEAIANPRVRLEAGLANPWDLIDGACAVYAVTSQMGFEAALAGKPVRCFGAPFYAGWGATIDEAPVARRTARRSAAQIFAAAYLRYPVYFDPWRGDRIECEEAMRALAFLRDARGADPQASVALGARLWKRRYVAGFLDRPGAPTVFEDDAAKAAAKAAAEGRRLVAWAGKATDRVKAAAVAEGAPLWRLEDGFLRSAGLGAALTPPLSLALDDAGIYYDPSQPSRLERLIEAAPDEEASLERAARLRSEIVRLNITKYNLSADAPVPAPDGARRILIPGQVEDDASIRTGAGEIRTNADLIRAARAAAPDAWLIYKPHPDVEAGLRAGAVDGEALRLVDHVAAGAPAHAALEAADEVWTITSLMGFEALMREKTVVTFGAPFYAGWGLTDDRGAPPARRRARPTIDQLVHAALIDYPVYRDPVSGRSCPPEVIIERLASGEAGGGPARLRALSKLQGLFATYAHLWR